MSDAGARLHTFAADLAKAGLSTAMAGEVLEVLGLPADEGQSPEARRLVRALSGCADADTAFACFRSLAGRRPDGWREVLADQRRLDAVARVAAASPPLADLLVGDAEALGELLGDLEPHDRATVRARCEAALAAAGGADAPIPAAAAALVAVQRRGLLRVAVRDLLGLADTPRAAEELADLAEGVLAAALAHVLHGVDGVRMAVIGMGKLGGRELNYVSDVDVLFVAEGDWAATTKVAERFLRLLGTATPQGVAYEVDPNLRPEGRDGPLVRSLDAYETYYQRWAKTWELQALLKARAVAGDADLGAAFEALRERHVWPERLQSDAVADIQRMKGVVEASREVQRHGARQLKLGPGGLRDIEFAVQLLQLVHGRHDRSLRSQSTLPALRALADGGYVDEGDANLFSDAYQFLRTVEHRLQLRRLRRTHTVPRDDGARYRLARSCGFRDLRQRSALEQFDAEFRRVQAAVRRLHEQLFYRPLLDRFAQVSAEDVATVAGGETGLDEDAARDRLAALGFARPERALADLRALASGVSRQAQLFRTLLPALLPTIAAAPDPDGGLAAFRSLAEKLGGSPFFLRTLRDTPPVGELLARVLGASRLVGEWLERQPEVLGLLSDLPGLAQELAPEDYRRLADGLVRRGADLRESADALRRLRRRELARIAVRDLSGQADVAAVGRELSGLAEACLEAAVALVVPEGIRFAVIGMGKLGGRELGYPSDLDVLFVFEPADAREQALQAAERLLETLSGITPEGQAFRVDVGLRPEGKDGPMARSLDSYRAYYERWAETWELQALTQARPVAGDRSLGDDFIAAITDLVYPQQVPASRLQAVRMMKARVERERGAQRPAGARARPRMTPRRGGLTGHGTAAAARGGQAGRTVAGARGGRVDLKLGSGGLSDVEWTLQLLQLQHGGRIPALRVPGARAALAACREAGLLGARDASWLGDGLDLLSRVRNALYLGGLRDASRLPPGVADTERIARMLGYPSPGGQALLEDVSRVMRRVRRVHEQVFYPS